MSLTWIKTSDSSRYQPCTQVYGVVFNDQGEILLIQEKGHWKIPGGTPEAGETPQQTLERELMEEADVTVQNIQLLGVQQVDWPGNTHTAEGERFYQYRYICQVKELQQSTPDPDEGIIHPRKFVPASSVTEHVLWGETGRAMFADAIAAASQLLGPKKTPRQP
jgi:ADP-ribose pyrophosphatase YjhB (NUDIX family)